jgi:hypothetical protein|tara:strand:+ start:640 stop:786 length:147 start_codon:yes stop_codon:yes gene_type:complete
MSFKENILRNEFRFRKASRRFKLPMSHTLEIYEAIEAQKLGLDKEVAK